MISCKKIYLCSPDLKPICVLNGVQTNSVTYTTHVKDYSLLTFTVDRYLNDVDDNGMPITFESSGYKDLKVYMYLYLEDIGYFQMQQPKIYGDGNHEQKEIMSYSIEKEFEQKSWLGLKINTGETDSIEYLADDNIDELGFAKEYVTLLNNDNPQLSFLHLMIDKCKGWEIGEVDESIATKKIPFIDSENTNLYALMTSEVAPRMRMLFVFDFLNKRINCYDQNSINYDTNIYITFRNLANKIELNVDEDSVYTRFRVRGNDDFLLNDWNLNSDIIMNISYFLGEPYMSEELANRVKDWWDLRERLRVECANISMEQAQLNEKLTKLNYAVPSDASYWKNWDNMNLEGLNENLKYYNARLRQLRISVDDRPDDEKYENPSDPTTYIPVKDEEGNVDDEYYEGKLYNSENEFKGYYTYVEIITYIIPYIEQAIRNLELPPDEQIKYGTEAEENWELYGYIELQGKLKSYEEDKLPMLKNFEKPWNELTDEQKLNYVNETGYNNAGRLNYLHYVEEIGDENTEGTMKYRLNELKGEIEDVEAQLAELAERRQQVIDDAQLNPYFNEEEINLINTLFIDTDYTNSNILVTDIDDVYTSMNTEKELYDDSMEMLSIASQPQFKASVDLDNLLRLEEFEDWHDDFKLLHFIHVAIRDDYSIKLRIVGMTWNPCEITPTLTLEFSNMITSYRGYTDLDDLLNTQNFRGQPNSISIGNGGSKTELDYIQRLIDELQKQGYFSKIISSEVQNTQTANIDGDYANSLISDYLNNVNVSNVNVESVATKMLQSDSATITRLFSEKVQANEVVTNFLEAAEAQIINLVAESATITDLVAENISTEKLVSKLIQATDLEVENIQSKFITSDIINTRILEADEATIDFLSSKIITADNATLKKLISDQIEAATIIADQITVDKIIGTEGEFKKFFVDHLDVEEVFGNNATFNTIVANAITTNSIVSKLADIDQANIDTLFVNTAFANAIQALSSTTVTSVINDAYIYNAVAGKITVSDLKAGDITVSDSMRIISDNGNLVMNGNALQISGKDKDGNPYVGVQLGYATDGKPSLVLRNEEGSVIVDPTGITQDAIADGLIINNMISDGTISEDKLGFSVMKQGDTISIEKVMTGSGSFGVEYTEFKNGTNDAINGLKKDIEDTANYDLHIETPNGTNIWGGNIQLNVRLLKNNIDVTDDFDASCFIWTRTSRDHDADLYWNSNHENGAKVITITANDVRINADFQCKFEYENIAIVAG